MSIHDAVEKLHLVSTETAGKLAIAAGGAGLTVQWLTEYGSLIVIAINIILGLGGIVLLGLRMGVALKDRRRHRRANKQY